MKNFPSHPHYCRNFPISIPIAPMNLKSEHEDFTIYVLTLPYLRGGQALTSLA